MSAELDTEDARPWEQPGAVRKDCQPHRAELLSVLGLAAHLCGAGSYLAVGGAGARAAR